VGFTFVLAEGPRSFWLPPREGSCRRAKEAIRDIREGSQGRDSYALQAVCSRKLNPPVSAGGRLSLGWFHSLTLPSPGVGIASSKAEPGLAGSAFNPAEKYEKATYRSLTPEPAQDIDFQTFLSRLQSEA
jgi:hypothetical protein